VDTTRIPPAGDPFTSAPAHPSTREARALELYRTRGRDIERIAPDVYLVPSCSGEATYRVDYGAESCSCPDHEVRGEGCKHIFSVGILRARGELPARTPRQ
jgi:hypothetical protein